MRIFTELKDFDYEFPELYYDKDTGEVKVKEVVKKEEKRKKILSDWRE